MRAYLQRADQILSQTNGGSSANATMSAAALEGVYAAYSPLRSSESLRLAAFGSDGTLNDFDAMGSLAAKGRDPFALSTLSEPVLSSTISLGLIVLFLVIGFAPWLLYRYLPTSLVLLLDQFSLAHQIRAGSFVQKVPTQFGAIASWSFSARSPTHSAPSSGCLLLHSQARLAQPQPTGRSLSESTLDRV